MTLLCPVCLFEVQTGERIYATAACGDGSALCQASNRCITYETLNRHILKKKKILRVEFRYLLRYLDSDTNTVIGTGLSFRSY